MRHLHGKARTACAAAPDLAGARAIATRLWLGRTNPYSGGPFLEEPSPGNYVLELLDGKVAYAYYDARGARIDPDLW
jgi:hypothetical protein